MKLPHRDQAFIPRFKLSDYLLSEAHAAGSAKAGFFRSHGFNQANAHLLQERLLAMGRNEAMQGVVSSPYGMKYVREGPLQTETGPIVNVRTVCIIEKESGRPRFVTASGETLAVLTLTDQDVRPVQGSEILHVRSLLPA